MAIPFITAIAAPVAMFALKIALSTIGVSLVKGIPLPSRALPKANAPTHYDSYFIDKEILKASSTVWQWTPDILALRSGTSIDSPLVAFIAFDDELQEVHMSGVQNGAPAGFFKLDKNAWNAVFAHYARAK